MADVPEALREAVEGDSPVGAPCTAIDEFLVIAHPPAVNVANRVIGWMGRDPCLDAEDLVNRASKPLWIDPHRDHPRIKKWIDAGPQIRARLWKLLIWRGRDVLEEFGRWQQVERDLLARLIHDKDHGLSVPDDPSGWDAKGEIDRTPKPVDRLDLLERLVLAQEAFLDLARAAWRLPMRLVAFAAGMTEEVYEPLPLGQLRLRRDEEDYLGAAKDQFLAVMRERRSLDSQELAHLLHMRAPALRRSKDRAPEYLFNKTVLRGAAIRGQGISPAKITAWLRRGKQQVPGFLLGAPASLPQPIKPHWAAIELALQGGPPPFAALGVRPEDAGDVERKGVQEFLQEIISTRARTP